MLLATSCEDPLTSRWDVSGAKKTGVIPEVGRYNFNQLGIF